MLNNIKKKIKFYTEYHLKALFEPIIEEKLDQMIEIRSQLKEFENAPETEKASCWEKKFDAQQLVNRFSQVGIEVEEVEIDIKDFKKWMEDFPSLVKFYSNMDDARIEKILEHYITLKYLNVKPTDIIIDVAAANSPFARILKQKGMKAYRQDLIYQHGMNGYDIGGNADDMPVANGFADVLTLHCAFECFQGDSDIRFAREAARILRKGGRIGIVPLYIDTIHFVKTSPWCDKRKIKVEPEVKWLWRDDKYHEPFSRHYSPEAFVTRITSQMLNMEKKILYFANLSELSNSFSGQRIYCYFMFKGKMP